MPEIEKNVLLKDYTAFKIGGSARYFFTARTKEDLVKALIAAKKFKTPFFILGKGSNVLVSDKGFKGLVIKILNSKFRIINSELAGQAGAMLGELASAAANNGLTGLEWATGIPGTVGGAIYGNAGTKEESIGDIIKTVEVFDVKAVKVKKLSKRECKFGYRDSIFKRRKHLIILSCRIQLKEGEKGEIKRMAEDFISARKKTQPLNLPSAGSIFKNPPGFFAGKLIEEMGLKGKKAGQAQISEKHANFIVNLGGARARDVKKLIDLIKRKAKKKFGVNLEEEIQYLGIF